ncbi:MAG: LCP family protein [Actinobacteria bacterium]|nr:LCP family protein [Actinomycetota bacterium]
MSFDFKNGGRSGEEEEKDTGEGMPPEPENDFFKDDDFEFEDYSGDDLDDEGYRSRRIREKKKRRKLLYSTIAVIIIVIIVATAIVFGYRYIKNRWFSQAEAGPEESVINVPESLELGQDINIIMATAGQDLLEPEVSSIIFSSYYSASNELRSLCIPARTLMDVPGIGAELAGKAVEIGGMDLLSLTLEKGLGMDIKIDHFVLFDIANVVDKLGGIELDMDVAMAVKDYDSDTSFELEPGPNLMDGSEVANFLKYVSGMEKDVKTGYIDYQKKVLDTVITKIVGETEEDLTNNINLVKSYIDSDLSMEELIKLFATVSGLGADKNTVHVLGVSSTELEGEGIVYLPDVSNLSGLFNKDEAATSETAVQERTVSIRILNGVGTPGIAGELESVLKAQVFESGKEKFNVLEVGNADNWDYTATEIIVYTSGEPEVMNAANELKSLIGTGSITTRQEEVVVSDIVIILGSDYNPGFEGAEETEETEGQEGEVSGITNIVILNGEGTAGLAKTVKDILEDHFNADTDVIKVVETKDADNWDYTQTEIRYSGGEGMEALAQQIQERLKVGVIKKSDSNPDGVGITVLIGSDYTSK